MFTDTVALVQFLSSAKPWIGLILLMIYVPAVASAVYGIFGKRVAITPKPTVADVMDVVTKDQPKV